MEMGIENHFHSGTSTLFMEQSEKFISSNRKSKGVLEQRPLKSAVKQNILLM